MSSILCLVLLLGLPLGLQAQQSEMAAGLNMGISSQPEEKEFQTTGQTVDLYFDYASMRVGYNRAESYLNTNFYDHSWAIKLKSESYYGAWRFGERQGTHAYGLLGATYQVNTLSLTNGIPTMRTQDYGWLTGAGFLFDLGRVFVGLQWTLISGKSSFEDLALATGSSQVQLSTSVPF